MDIEENRLYSFSEWPESASPVNAAELAQAGFYYSGENQQLICFGCGIVIRDLTQIDQVIARHREFQPRCTFVNDTASVDTILSQGKGTASSFVSNLNYISTILQFEQILTFTQTI